MHLLRLSARSSSPSIALDLKGAGAGGTFLRSWIGICNGLRRDLDGGNSMQGTRVALVAAAGTDDSGADRE